MVEYFYHQIRYLYFTKDTAGNVSQFYTITNRTSESRAGTERAEGFLCDFYYQELADAVRYFKETEEGQREMSDIVRAYGERCAAEAAEKATEKAEKKRISDLFHIIQNLMDAFKLTAEQAMATTKVNEHDQLILREMFA